MKKTIILTTTLALLAGGFSSGCFNDYREEQEEQMMRRNNQRKAEQGEKQEKQKTREELTIETSIETIAAEHAKVISEEDVLNNVKAKYDVDQISENRLEAKIKEQREEMEQTRKNRLYSITAKPVALGFEPANNDACVYSGIILQDDKHELYTSYLVCNDYVETQISILTNHVIKEKRPIKVIGTYDTDHTLKIEQLKIGQYEFKFSNKPDKPDISKKIK
ncbi:hypothetical protein HON01_10260 [Candidatus Woesearchaeota archaeon]|nr:hypothetical protein [Candidatus Woesearchaeota archaeon]